MVVPVGRRTTWISEASGLGMVSLRLLATLMSSALSLLLAPMPLFMSMTLSSMLLFSMGCSPVSPLLLAGAELRIESRHSPNEHSGQETI